MTDLRSSVLCVTFDGYSTAQDEYYIVIVISLCYSKAFVPPTLPAKS